MGRQNTILHSTNPHKPFKFNKIKPNSNKSFKQIKANKSKLNSVEYNNFISSIFPKLHNDSRPYVVFTVRGCQFHALLDSGAQISVIGNNFHQTFIDMGFNLETTKFTAATADGKPQTVIGYLTLPVWCY